MKGYTSFFITLVVLAGTSFLSYFIQNAIFHRSEDTFFYMLQDIAFLPIQVMLVTFVINALLSRREKQALLGKMNMVIGAFFSEMGTDLLKIFSMLDGGTDEIRGMLAANDWSTAFLLDIKKRLRAHEYRISADMAALEGLRGFLLKKRAFLMGLLENSNLLEHESFTDMLWAVCHLTEELSYREDLERLPGSDTAHLAGDIRRAYSLLIVEWLDYAAHLKANYPFMFSLIVRINPYNKDSNPVVY